MTDRSQQAWLRDTAWTEAGGGVGIGGGEGGSSASPDWIPAGAEDSRSRVELSLGAHFLRALAHSFKKHTGCPYCVPGALGDTGNTSGTAEMKMLTF